MATFSTAVNQHSFLLSCLQSIQAAFPFLPPLTLLNNLHRRNLQALFITLLRSDHDAAWISTANVHLVGGRCSKTNQLPSVDNGGHQRHIRTMNGGSVRVVAYKLVVFIDVRVLDQAQAGQDTLPPQRELRDGRGRLGAPGHEAGCRPRARLPF